MEIRWGSQTEKTEEGKDLDGYGYGGGEAQRESKQERKKDRKKEGSPNQKTQRERKTKEQAFFLL